MQIELKRIQREVGITFVYVTHDQEEALTMSDRLAVFNHGRIEQIGPPAEVYEHPASEFIAGFVGVSNVIERDGRRYTVRPEKIHVLVEGREPRGRVARGGGARSRRPVRRAGDPVPRHARPGRRAAGARAEPRGDLERGAGDEGTPRAARSGVPEQESEIDEQEGGRHDQKTNAHRRAGRTRPARGRRSRRRRGLRGRRRERRRALRSKGSARRSRRSRRTPRRRARSTSSSWAGYATVWSTSSRRRPAARSTRRTAAARTTWSR